MKLSVSEIAAAVNGRLLTGDPGALVSGTALDSRKIRKGDLFLPIRGEKVDSHRFLLKTFADGAACSFTEEHGSEKELLSDLRFAGQELLPGAAVIAVDSTAGALQRLAAWYRKEKVHIPVVGITGSVGKTTTREMVACALSAGMRVFQTPGNANSQLSLPMTVLDITDDYDIAVLELGMSEPGEMTRIANCARVNVAIMTNIGVSHIAQLGSRENILNEKLHILDGCAEGAVLFLNERNDLLSRVDDAYLEAFPSLCGRKIRIERYGSEEDEASLPVLRTPGEHMRLNAMAALRCAEHFGIDARRAREALSSFTGVAGRGSAFFTDGITIFDSSYNAAPDSMKAELSVLMNADVSGRRFAVLADMKELGPEEVRFHREVGSYLSGLKGTLCGLWLYGPLAKEIGNGYVSGGGPAEVRCFSSLEALQNALHAELKAGDAVLLKGSHSMGLSAAADAFRKREKAEA